MGDLQELVALAKSGEMSVNDFLSTPEVKVLIRSYAANWHSKTPSYNGKRIDGRDYDERVQICRIECWQALKAYKFDKGAKFTTFYYAHMKNQVLNLVKKDSRKKEVANSYSNCFSYDFTLGKDESFDKEEEHISIDREVIQFEYGAIEVEMALRDEGFDELTIEIVKFKMEHDKMSNNEIALTLGYSRAHIGVLWNKAKEFLSGVLVQAL